MSSINNVNFTLTKYRIEAETKNAFMFSEQTNLSLLMPTTVGTTTHFIEGITIGLDSRNAFLYQLQNQTSVKIVLDENQHFNSFTGVIRLFDWNLLDYQQEAFKWKIQAIEVA